MSLLLSKSRSKKSRQRDREERRQKKNEPVWPLKNMLMAILFWISGMSMIHLGGRLQYSQLMPGQKAPATIVASTDFSCSDLTKTAIQQQQAAAAVPPVFRLNTTALDSAQRSVGTVFDALSEALALTPAAPGTNNTIRPEEAAIQDMLTVLNIQLSSRELAALTSTQEVAALRLQLQTCMNRLAVTPIVTGEERASNFRGLAPAGLITLMSTDDKTATPLQVAALKSTDDAAMAVVAMAADERPIPKTMRRLIIHFMQPWVAPNLVFDPIMTDQHREQARQQVPPVIAQIKAGSTLVEAGERITPAIQERLRAYEKRLQTLETTQDRLLHSLGDALLLVIALCICALLLRTFQPDLLHNDSALVLLLVLYVGGTGCLRGMFYLSNLTSWLNQALLIHLYPAVLIAMLATILLGGAAALTLGLLSACTAAIMLGYSFQALFLGIFLTVVTMRAAYGIHRRKRVFRVGLITGCATLFFAAAMYVLHQPDWHVFAQQAVAGFLAGLVSAFLTLLLLPLLESLFHITTDITLLELSDMGNPLLQRLAIEAPGTYHHSLMVANLGAAAAQEVGANALAVRVGAYFHDIGKLTKPEFFVENAQHKANPHDDLSPSMSTLVVTSHVKEGLTLADRHKLPRVVRQAIEQHHGTSLVTYFYHRACKLLESETSQDGQGKAPAARINEQDFRYPGPRPQNPEMAILSLADSIEAASRSMEKTTGSRIENLVNEIVDRKMQDGQLDASDLTLRQLALIKKSFIFSLTSMLHGRVAYPKNEPADPPSPQAP